MRLSNLQPFCVDFTAKSAWLVVGRVFTETHSHHGVPLLLAGLALPLFGPPVVYMLHLCPKSLRSRHNKLSLRLCLLDY